ncbi:hypothetical protein [Mucilaginibacter sp.]|uniref:hypothetical protein n=1 Tax=Mucilaginibacter sp. TaxID=1882438 RepID=UPI00374DF790
MQINVKEHQSGGIIKLEIVSIKNVVGAGWLIIIPEGNVLITVRNKIWVTQPGNCFSYEFTQKIGQKIDSLWAGSVLSNNENLFKKKVGPAKMEMVCQL